MQEIELLPEERQKQVLDFVEFIGTRTEEDERKD